MAAHPPAPSCAGSVDPTRPEALRRLPPRSASIKHSTRLADESSLISRTRTHSLSIHIMKTLGLLVLFTASALGAAPQRQVVVTYPKDTPDAVLTEAKSAIEKAVSIHRISF